MIIEQQETIILSEKLSEYVYINLTYNYSYFVPFLENKNLIMNHKFKNCIYLAKLAYIYMNSGFFYYCNLIERKNGRN